MVGADRETGAVVVNSTGSEDLDMYLELVPLYEYFQEQKSEYEWWKSNMLVKQSNLTWTIIVNFTYLYL